MDLTHGSLFSGIGGFDLGFERAGFKTIWQVEIDPYCQAILAKHFPQAQRFRNIKRFRSCKTLTPVDVITGGFPCQPFSVAGKRCGTADDRYLWPEMRRVIEEVRPRWVVAENVPGLIKLALDQVLSDLEALGYTVGAVTIPACAVDAPHRRERLWIVGYAESSQRGLSTQSRTDDLESQRSGADVAHAAQQRGQRRPMGPRQAEPQGPHERVAGLRRWEPEPGVGRVAHGVPHRVDRLKALGNAIVPQIAEEIGRMILAVEQESKS